MQFAGLEGRRRWLDIATGNGALPLLWAQHNGDALARCDAVDVAQILTPKKDVHDAATLARIHWHSGTAAERLHFDAASVDVAMSQYGFEYAVRDEAVAEVARVLAPGGALRLVMHHADGRPAQLARAEIAHIDELTSPDGLWTLACKIAEPFSRSGSAEGRAALARDPALDVLRRAFNDAQDRGNQAAANSICPDVLHECNQAVAALLQRAVQQGLPAARKFEEQWSLHLRDSRMRLSELLEHALDASALTDLVSRLEPHCRFEACTPLHDGPYCMAWALSATRR